MSRYKVVRMFKNGDVSYDYGWGSKDWMMNMVYKEIEFCRDDEYVRVEIEEIDYDEE